MIELLKLSDDDLRVLADALESQRLQPPYTAFSIALFVSGGNAVLIGQDLQGLGANGLGPRQVAQLIRAVLSDRMKRQSVDDMVDLVTTGPECEGDLNRDTSVVVRNLFGAARHSVLVVGYAVYQGRVVFEALANRMLENPKLTVRMFLDIKRDAADTSASSELIHRFTHRFRTEQWPQERPMPRVYYYPAALDLASRKKASLHAKCVVVDLQDVFVSSANFTEAAQYRNIEMGLLVRSASLANRVTGHFETLLENGLLAEAIFP